LGGGTGKTTCGSGVITPTRGEPKAKREKGKDVQIRTKGGSRRGGRVPPGNEGKKMPQVTKTKKHGQKRKGTVFK